MQNFSHPCASRPSWNLSDAEGVRICHILRPGYAIEYDFRDPTQLYPWLETRKIPGLSWQGR